MLQRVTCAYLRCTTSYHPLIPLTVGQGLILHRGVKDPPDGGAFFSCSSPVWKQDVKDRTLYAKHLCAHVRAWHEHARRVVPDVDIAIEDLVLVTGCHLTASSLAAVVTPESPCGSSVWQVDVNFEPYHEAEYPLSSTRVVFSSSQHSFRRGTSGVAEYACCWPHTHNPDDIVNFAAADNCICLRGFRVKQRETETKESTREKTNLSEKGCKPDRLDRCHVLPALDYILKANRFLWPSADILLTDHSLVNHLSVDLAVVHDFDLRFEESSNCIAYVESLF
ncbi:hypothetical protein BV25DRAFT_900885 [Artomyces pyxidatus]|uniref:Uncharacterized protein n=1 Tax=Artomyces pyxidatus TaxID=48021 RepID=A0ACB8SWH7_9AGAM|nr:hypothetical protein BV25DRAFT_900885 [Artomyces pyxidatus]